MNDILKHRVLAYNRAVPRYTSYPTAPHFRDGFTDSEWRAWLGALRPGQTLSLYVHIPFCPKLCWFCGCNTKITRHQQPVDDYMAILHREIGMASQVCAQGLPVKFLHFGGGSPTMLSGSGFEELMACLRAHFTFAPDAEIAVELDPRHFTPELARAYARSKVTRVSFGVQDYDDKVMKAVNREQPFEVVREGVERARGHGIGAVNIDLIYGLPYQTLQTMGELVEKTVSLAPDRIALFGYAHVPWMKKHMRLIPESALPDNDLRYDLFEIAARGFEAAGYAPVGIDHFARADDALIRAAKEGRMRRNFQGYTTDDADALLGFGASAISRLPQGYAQNTVHGPQYRDRVAGGHFPVEKARPLSADDRLRADIIEGLICDMSVDLNAVCARHGARLADLADDIARLEALTGEGMVRIEDGRVTVSVRQMARLACAAFDAYLKPPAADAPRHVSAV